MKLINFFTKWENVFSKSLLDMGYTKLVEGHIKSVMSKMFKEGFYLG